MARHLGRCVVGCRSTGAARLTRHEPQLVTSSVIHVGRPQVSVRHFGFASDTQRGTRKTRRKTAAKSRLANVRKVVAGDKSGAFAQDSKTAYTYRKSPLEQRREKKITEGRKLKGAMKKDFESQVKSKTEELKFMSAGNPKEMANIRRAAKKGNADAQFNLGIAYLPGESFKSVGFYVLHACSEELIKQDDDLKLAAKWLQRAAEQGHGPAAFMLHSALHDQPMGTLTKDDCESFLHDALVANYPPAHYMVVMLLTELAGEAPEIELGLAGDIIADQAFTPMSPSDTLEQLNDPVGFNETRDQTIRYLKSRNDPEAKEQPSRMELLSSMRAHCVQLTIHCMAEGNQGEFMLFCANVFMQGQGGPKDIKLARICLERGTNMGHADCTQALGMMMAVDGDPNAMKLIKKAEEIRENSKIVAKGLTQHYASKGMTIDPEDAENAM